MGFAKYAEDNMNIWIENNRYKGENNIRVTRQTSGKDANKQYRKTHYNQKPKLTDKSLW